MLTMMMLGMWRTAYIPLPVACLQLQARLVLREESVRPRVYVVVRGVYVGAARVVLHIAQESRARLFVLVLHQNFFMAAPAPHSGVAVHSRPRFDVSGGGNA